jgi:hypothetical protein
VARYVDAGATELRLIIGSSDERVRGETRDALVGPPLPLMTRPTTVRSNVEWP